MQYKTSCGENTSTRNDAYYPRECIGILVILLAKLADSLFQLEFADL